MKTCENCGNEHDGSIGSGRFCSLKCSRSFSTKAKRKEINDKVSAKRKGIGNDSITKKCENCEATFIVSWSKRNKTCCSVSCSGKLRWKNAEYRKNISEKSSMAAIKRHQSGKNFGWQTRKKFSASYPESLAIEVLDSVKIEYEREFKIGRFFVDFVIHSSKIAIEIDGRQHEKEDRKRNDRAKDLLLIENGWKIYRISYPKENVKDKIKEILASIPSP
jgi:very-short-patch-repair endonuclease